MRGTSLFRPLISYAAFAVLAGFAVSTTSAAAQNSIPDRIAAVVSNTSRSVIPGSVSPRVSAATDLGPLPAETRLEGMSLRFLPSAAQQAALDQLLADQQNPASPRYHQWLTPLQYAAQFGLSSNDIAKITAWLTSQGFTVTGVANGGTFITFDGTVAQVQTAFSTSIHSLSLNGVTHFANISEPSVPSSFAGVVGAITGLHDFRARPHLHTSIVKPNFTSSQTGNHFLAPGDLYTIYDVQPLLTSGLNGAGIGTGPVNCKSVGTPQPTCGDIAVMGTVDISTADIANFRNAAGLSTANLPTTVHEGTDPGPANNCTPGGTTKCAYPNLLDLDESFLDLEWAGAMAPSANILLVNGKDIFNNSMTQAIDQNLAPIITISYGECEAGWGSSFLNSFNSTTLKEASAQGQTILSASGDTGATDCEVNTESAATEGLAVDFPGSSPYITSMGGTMFNGDGAATGSGTTWSTTQYWKGTSGSDVVNSALSYIPEAAWNDLSNGDFGGGGGGASSFFAKPAWQVETGPSGMTTQVSPDSARDVPDLALTASDIHDSYLICAQGWCTNGFRNSSGYFNGGSLFGGTSFDAPIFSGMLALVEQKVGSRLGNINPTLYALGNKAAYYNTTGSNPSGGTSVFHDVTSGGNAMQCVAGTTQCPGGVNIGYSAGTGYDLATGWGSVDLYNLANAWNLVTPLGSGALGANLSATALTTNISSSATTCTVIDEQSYCYPTSASGTAVTLTASVSSATSGFTTTPTGSVQFLINNVAVGSAVTLTSGVATYAWTPSCSTLGQQSITAVYSGDSNYQGSIGPALTANPTSTNSSGAIINTPLIVTVTSGSTCPNFMVTAPAGNVTVAAGGTIPPVTITATSLNGLAGTVTFSYSLTEATSGYQPSISLIPISVTLAANGTATTTLTLSGITASLRQPIMPGKMDPGTMLARQGPARTPSWFAAGSGVTIASLLLLVLPRRRRLGGLLLVALSVALVFGATGCGGSSQPGPPSTSANPYAGTYQITVIGTFSGSTTIPPANTTVTYVIN